MDFCHLASFRFWSYFTQHCCFIFHIHLASRRRMNFLRRHAVRLVTPQRLAVQQKFSAQCGSARPIPASRRYHKSLKHPAIFILNLPASQRLSVPSFGDSQFIFRTLASCHFFYLLELCQNTKPTPCRHLHAVPAHSFPAARLNFFSTTQCRADLIPTVDDARHLFFTNFHVKIWTFSLFAATGSNFLLEATVCSPSMLTPVNLRPLYICLLARRFHRKIDLVVSSLLVPSHVTSPAIRETAHMAGPQHAAMLCT